MPIVGPDDPARDLRWLFIGPKGFRLPAAPIATYGMFFGVWGATSLVAFVSVANPRQWLIATLVLFPIAAVATKLLTTRLDSVRTVRFYRDMLAADTRAPRPPIDNDEGTEHRLSPATFTRKDSTP